MSMPRRDGAAAPRLVLFEGQQALMDASLKAGFSKTGGYDDMIFVFKSTLDYPLPDGFRFVTGRNIDIGKCCECCRKGFNHEAGEGSLNGESEHGYHLLNAPHYGGRYDIIVEGDDGALPPHEGHGRDPHGGR